MTQKHTPTPWYAEKKEFTWVVGNKSKISYGDRIAELPQWGDKAGFGGRSEVAANAAFIVRACNAHDDLVEALRACLDQMNDLGHGGDAMYTKDHVKGMVRAALAKAKGETP